MCVVPISLGILLQFIHSLVSQVCVSSPALSLHSSGYSLEVVQFATYSTCFFHMLCIVVAGD